MVDHVGADGGWGARVRLRSLADLSMMRRRMRQQLTDAGIASTKVADTVLVASELATNAFEAAQPGSSVVVRLRIGDVTVGAGRYIELDVDNVGAPVDGALVPRPEHMSERTSPAGRGLAIAATLGDVVVEGRIGGSRAIFRTPTDG
jgi:anti-sigma regulatory factor (Ser/Thr protein kinase)